MSGRPKYVILLDCGGIWDLGVADTLEEAVEIMDHHKKDRDMVVNGKVVHTRRGKDAWVYTTEQGEL